jgi:hypothetical protein
MQKMKSQDYCVVIGGLRSAAGSRGRKSKIINQNAKLWSRFAGIK